MTAPTIDGLQNSGNAFHGSNVGTVTLTTFNSGVAVILLVASESATAHVTGISSTNTTGWTLRGTVQHFGSGRNINMEVWYGFATASLTTEVITVTLDTGIDSASIEAFGVHHPSGAYTSDPFDTDVSLPGFAFHQDYSGFVSTTPTVTGLSTVDTDPLVLGFYGSSAGSTATNGTSLFVDDTNTSGFGTHNALSAIGHHSPGAALSSASEAFGNSTFDWGVIVDAIAAPAASSEADLGIGAGLGADMAVTLEVEENFITNSGVGVTQVMSGLPPLTTLPSRDILINWLRRDRIDIGPLFVTDNVPMSEAVEKYDVEILNGGIVQRSFLGLTTNSVLYTAAMQIADGWTSVPQQLTVRVYQISAVVGRGFGEGVTVNVQ